MKDTIERLNELHAKMKWNYIPRVVDGQTEGYYEIYSQSVDDFVRAIHNTWPEIAAELTRLESECERLRQLYVDEHVSRCKHEIALNATEARVSELLRENQRLRAFEENMRSIAIDNAGTYPAIIHDALEDLDRKRGGHDGI